MSFSNKTVPWVILSSFVAGMATSILASNFMKEGKKDGRYAGAAEEGNDLSLFYGNVEELTIVTDSRKFLPSDLYGQLVRYCVVVCVDIVLVRKNVDNKKECLLVKRSSEPVKGIWWWPGGRILKGETFFDAAKRKAQQETGLTDVTCLQVLGVWNTFFPTSNWDTESEKGTQTVNAIVLVEVSDGCADVELDNTSEECKWISIDPSEAEKNGEDKYVVQGLLRLQKWDSYYVRSSTWIS